MYPMVNYGVLYQPVQGVREDNVCKNSSSTNPVNDIIGYITENNRYAFSAMFCAIDVLDLIGEYPMLHVAFLTSLYILLSRNFSDRYKITARERRREVGLSVRVYTRFFD